MKPGQILNNQYRIIREIHKGGQATVYLALHEKEELSFAKEVAIKVYNNEKDKESLNTSEIKVLCSLRHQNIAQIIDVGRHEESTYLVMEYIEGMDLRGIIKSFKDKNISSNYDFVAATLEQILSALIYIHSKDIFHRDLTPSNIMIDQNGIVKLIDFGISNLNTTQIAGKPIYLPSNYLNGESSYTKETELYALGIILYELATLQNIKTDTLIDEKRFNNKQLRNIFLNLSKNKKTASDIYELIKKITKHKNTDYKGLVKKLSDERYIADSTIIDFVAPRKQSFKSNNIRWISLTVSSLLTIASFIFFYQNKNKADLEISLMNISTKKSTKIKSPRLSNPFTINLPNSFSLNAQENYCYNYILSIVPNHKESYEINMKDSFHASVNEKSFQDQFNFFSSWYHEIASYYIFYRPTFKYFTTVCLLSDGFQVYIEQNASIGLANHEYKNNLYRLMSGSDKVLAKMVQNARNNKIKPPKKYLKYRLIPKKTFVELNVALTDDPITLDTCRDLGDLIYLENTRFKKQRENLGILNEVEIVLLNNIKEIYPAPASNKPEEYFFDLKETSRKVQVCQYIRKNGELKILQTWDNLLD